MFDLPNGEGWEGTGGENFDAQKQEQSSGGKVTITDRDPSRELLDLATNELAVEHQKKLRRKINLEREIGKNLLRFVEPGSRGDGYNLWRRYFKPFRTKMEQVAHDYKSSIEGSNPQNLTQEDYRRVAGEVLKLTLEMSSLVIDVSRKPVTNEDFIREGNRDTKLDFRGQLKDLEGLFGRERQQFDNQRNRQELGLTEVVRQFMGSHQDGRISENRQISEENIVDWMNERFGKVYTRLRADIEGVESSIKK